MNELSELPSMKVGWDVVIDGLIDVSGMRTYLIGMMGRGFVGRDGYSHPGYAVRDEDERYSEQMNEYLL